MPTLDIFSMEASPWANIKIRIYYAINRQSYQENSLTGGLSVTIIMSHLMTEAEKPKTQT